MNKNTDSFFFNLTSPTSIALLTIDLQIAFSRHGGQQAAENTTTLLHRTKKTSIHRVGVYMDKNNDGPYKARKGFHGRTTPKDYHFVHAKEQPDAFKTMHPANQGKTLHFRLKSAGITHLVLTGHFTNWCVKESAITAKNIGFKVLVLDDCIHSFWEHGKKGLKEMEKANVAINSSQCFKAGLREHLQLQI